MSHLSKILGEGNVGQPEPTEVPPYECPNCMQDLKGSARCCPNCKLNLPRDWLDARLWMLIGESPKQKMTQIFEYLCPLCDQPVGADLACEDCQVTGVRRVIEEGEEEDAENQ